jgi:hypothetical protein
MEVWRKSFEPRTVNFTRSKKQEHHFTTQEFSSTTRSPTTLSVTKESRAETLRNYTRVLVDAIARPFYFWFAQDSLEYADPSSPLYSSPTPNTVSIQSLSLGALEFLDLASASLIESVTFVVGNDLEADVDRTIHLYNALSNQIADSERARRSYEFSDPEKCKLMRKCYPWMPCGGRDGRPGTDTREENGMFTGDYYASFCQGILGTFKNLREVRFKVQEGALRLDYLEHPARRNAYRRKWT